jgi:hypothetical protein
MKIVRMFRCLLLTGTLIATAKAAAQTATTKVFLAAPTAQDTSPSCTTKTDEIKARIIKTEIGESAAAAALKEHQRLCDQSKVMTRRFLPTRSPGEVHAYFGDQRHVGGMGQLRTTNSRTVVNTELVTGAIRGVRISLGTAFATGTDSVQGENSATQEGAIDRLLTSGGNLAFQAQAPLMRWATNAQDVQLHVLAGTRFAVDVPALGGVYTNIPNSWALQVDAGLLLKPTPDDLQLAFGAHLEGLGQSGFIAALQTAASPNQPRRSGNSYFLTLQGSAIIRKGLQVGFEVMPWRGNLLEKAPRNRLLLSVSL